MPARFDHERLTVYQRSLEFVRWAGTPLERIPARTAARDQLDRASTSIPLNTGRGSALECAAVLDVLVARGVLAEAEVEAPKGQRAEFVSMPGGIIRSQSRGRVHEEPVRYGADRGWED
jgi:hypothetical protein